jgi:hypothetical protein
MKSAPPSLLLLASAANSACRALVSAAWVSSSVVSLDNAIAMSSTRQQLPNNAPNSNSWYTMTTLQAGDSNCLFSLLGVDGSVPYPIRFEPCDPLNDNALWKFVPDSDGRYFIYNKAWGGTEQRLDINRQGPSLFIMWMGLSGDKYNNQRWFLVIYPAV